VVGVDQRPIDIEQSDPRHAHRIPPPARAQTTPRLTGIVVGRSRPAIDASGAALARRLSRRFTRYQAGRDQTEVGQTQPNQEPDAMPPRGVKKNSKRGRQYEHIKESQLDQGRSEDVAEEIAARTVNKERARPDEPHRP